MRVSHPDMHDVVQATTHAEQQGALHTERLTVLQDQLEQANGQLLKMELSAKHAGSQQSSLKAQRDDLQRKLTVCEGEIRQLESKLSAACMESAGGGSSLPDSVQSCGRQLQWVQSMHIPAYGISVLMRALTSFKGLTMLMSATAVLSSSLPICEHQALVHP